MGPIPKIHAFLTKNKLVVIIVIFIAVIAGVLTIWDTVSKNKVVCDPYEILETYENLKSENESYNPCESNLTLFNYENCGFSLEAYLFDQCDVKNLTLYSPNPKNFGDYFLVYPFWNKTKGDYYLLDVILESGERGSVYVTTEKILKWVFIETDQTRYELSLNVSTWEAEEWGVLAYGYNDEEFFYLLFKSINDLNKRGLVQKNIPELKLEGTKGIIYWGSDLNGENQANAVISTVPKETLLDESSWVWSKLKK